MSVDRAGFLSSLFFFQLVIVEAAGGYSSVVEHLTADQEVSSSNLDAPCPLFLSLSSMLAKSDEGSAHVSPFMQCSFSPLTKHSVIKGTLGFRVNISRLFRSEFCLTGR